MVVAGLPRRYWRKLKTINLPATTNIRKSLSDFSPVCLLSVVPTCPVQKQTHRIVSSHCHNKSNGTWGWRAFIWESIDLLRTLELLNGSQKDRHKHRSVHYTSTPTRLRNTEHSCLYQQRPANLKHRTFQLLPPNAHLLLFLSLTFQNSFQIICHKTLLSLDFAPSELHYFAKQHQEY
jgi:hypothetical protein